jgi:membrane protease YdiL (CAAX protease family)
MAVLGWIANPLLDDRVDGASGIHGTARTLLLAVGLIWQFVLVVINVRREARSLAWPILRERLWLGLPRTPRTGKRDARLLLWLILLMPLFALSVFLIAPVLDKAWVTALPFLAEPPEFSLSQLTAPSSRHLIEGAWWFYGLFLVLALFNTVLGEELLFRGVLLPRMHGAFGKWDWLANGLLFGLYHLHQPWGMPHSILNGILLFALPTRIFRCAWMGIAIHSAQSIFFAVILLPLVLGR